MSKNLESELDQLFVEAGGQIDEKAFRAALEAELKDAAARAVARVRGTQQQAPEEQEENYRRDMQAAAGNNKQLTATKEKYRAAGVDVDHVSVFQSRKPEPPAPSPEEEQAEALADRYREEMLENRGKPYQVAREIKNKYLRLGLDVDSVRLTGRR